MASSESRPLRRTKIVATLGPACSAPAVLRQMLEAGVDGFRLNLSHGSWSEHEQVLRRIRRLGRSLRRDLAVLADLQGPRFRVGVFPGGSMELREGAKVRIGVGLEGPKPGVIPLPNQALLKVLKRGMEILLDDGALVLRVSRVRGTTVNAEVVRGGMLRDHKGFNLPGAHLPGGALTAKDREDLRRALAAGVDWIAMSFVRSRSDVEEVRRSIRRLGGSVPVMAKIEHPDALPHLEEIVEAADGIMVARGDLGVELPPERVPLVQKDILERAMERGRPAMIATQMLESMRTSPRPTRAEASDVANAVMDGASSLLLTAETAVGQFPVDSVRMTDRIAGAVERAGRLPSPPERASLREPSEAISLAAARLAERLGTRYVVAFTESGFTARAVAAFRPRVPVLAFAPNEGVRRRLALYWGVHARPARQARSTDALLAALDRALLSAGEVRPGERVVVLMGSPVGVPGSTNLVKVHTVGSD